MAAPALTVSPGPQGPIGPQGPAGPATPDARFGNDTGQAASGQGSPCATGQVILTAGAVSGAMPARGQILSISENEILFTLLGTMYGGDGQATFALPDLQDMAPNGLTYSICMFGIYPTRD